MVYDEFFTDSDKPYAENLNDSLLLLDAFDVTVPVELPGMFNNHEFSSTVDVPRKAGVGIITLKSASSGVTVGTSSISGTGTVVFRVYPNFNAFYKWSKIVLTKTGTVNIAFKKTDGTSISATVNSSGVISEASALKELQEIDVELTLSSATITKILIEFVNNQSSHTRTGALLEADQLVNVNGAVASGNTKAISGGTVYNALSWVNVPVSEGTLKVIPALRLANFTHTKRINVVQNESFYYEASELIPSGYRPIEYVAEVAPLSVLAIATVIFTTGELIIHSFDNVPIPETASPKVRINLMWRY